VNCANRPNLAAMAVRTGIDGIYNRSVGGLAIYNPAAIQLVGFEHRPSEPPSGMPKP
jgi:hypothetical protein